MMGPEGGQVGFGATLRMVFEFLLISLSQRGDLGMDKFGPRQEACNAIMFLHVQDTKQAYDLGAPWELIELPASGINIGSSQSISEDNNVLVSLPVTNDRCPLEPSQREKDVYGIVNATERWLRLAAQKICLSVDPAIAQALRELARSYELLSKLERHVLIYDIEVRFTFEH